MTTKVSEKRRTSRVPVRMPVALSTIDTFLDSEIMNLSKGGIFIQADITYALGTEIDLEFSLPVAKKTVKATGTVVWARRSGKATASSFPDHPSGMGIQFKEIHVKDVELILDEIEHLIGSP